MGKSLMKAHQATCCEQKQQKITQMCLKVTLRGCSMYCNEDTATEIPLHLTQ